MTDSLPRVIPVTGTAWAPFEPLAEILGRVVADQGAGGAALVVYRDGRPVVDLAAGDYAPDGIQAVFSVSKAVSAIAVAMLHADGVLDLDAPLGSYWPAFAKPSTATITTRDVLAHRSGLAVISAPLSLAQLLAGEAETALETQEPLWVPGTRHGYHSFTFGPLLDGVVRRATGRDVASHVRERIAEPLGAEFWLGLPDELHPRVRQVRFVETLLTPHQADRIRAGLVHPDAGVDTLLGHPQSFNTPEVLRSSWPSASGTATAHGLARIMAATLGTVDGVRLLDASARDAMRATRSRGDDAILGIPIHLGSGVQLPFPQFPMLGPGSYGHEAAGGSVAFADTETGLAIGFTTDVFPHMHGGSRQFAALLPTIRHLLEADPSTV
ncbi:MAG: serine hydrolase domain-containing protein [Protaetiibacter sp.]